MKNQRQRRVSRFNSVDDCDHLPHERNTELTKHKNRGKKLDLF